LTLFRPGVYDYPKFKKCALKVLCIKKSINERRMP
jgi:hypothetical protein